MVVETVPRAAHCGCAAWSILILFIFWVPARAGSEADSRAYSKEIHTHSSYAVSAMVCPPREKKLAPD